MTLPTVISRVSEATRSLALIALSFSGMVGCASADRSQDRLGDAHGDRSGAWIWTQPDRYAFQPKPERASPRGMGSHDPSIAVFSAQPTALARGDLARRDDLMGVRGDDALPDRLGWPGDDRSDLNRQRTFRSSTTAERWVFPSTRRDAGRGRGHNYFRGGY